MMSASIGRTLKLFLLADWHVPKLGSRCNGTGRNGWHASARQGRRMRSGTTPSYGCLGAGRIERAKNDGWTFEPSLSDIRDMLRINMIAFQVAMRGFQYRPRIALIDQSGSTINDEPDAPRQLATSSWRGP